MRCRELTTIIMPSMGEPRPSGKKKPVETSKKFVKFILKYNSPTCNAQN
jgi:hypothetical protein